MPLLKVAWADGRVQPAERALLDEVAGRSGLQPGDPWLQQWVVDRPSTRTVLAARQVLLALLMRDERQRVAPSSLEELIAMCVEVAGAAGGLFGLAFTVARTEREAIADIAESLSLGPAVPTEVGRAWDTPAASPAAAQPRLAGRDRRADQPGTGAGRRSPVLPHPRLGGACRARRCLRRDAGHAQPQRRRRGGVAPSDHHPAHRAADASPRWRSGRGSHRAVLRGCWTRPLVLNPVRAPLVGKGVRLRSGRVLACTARRCRNACLVSASSDNAGPWKNRPPGWPSSGPSCALPRASA